MSTIPYSPEKTIRWRPSGAIVQMRARHKLRSAHLYLLGQLQACHETATRECITALCHAINLLAEQFDTIGVN